MRGKAIELESQVLEMRLLCNTKVSVEDLSVMLDRKLQVLSEYKRDTELVNQKCSEITQQMRHAFGKPQTTWKAV